jgi:hypothetical protein
MILPLIVLNAKNTQEHIVRKGRRDGTLWGSEKTPFPPQPNRNMVDSKEGEYLVSKDPPLCTCPAFYFSSARGKAQKCYHLISLEMAIATGNYFTIMGHDEEIFILLGLLL